MYEGLVAVSFAINGGLSNEGVLDLSGDLRSAAPKLGAS